MKRRYLFYVVCLSVMLAFISIPNVLGSWATENIVVAWDEEYDTAPMTQFYKYLWTGGIVFVSPRGYNDWQWSRVLYHFNKWWGTYVSLEVIGTVKFDSVDTGTLDYTLYEAIEETGFRNGIYFGGKRATILMVWTLQDNDNLGGGAIPSERAFIVKSQEPWADDNTILHELTHLYVGDTYPVDTPHGNCLMSSEKYFIGLYNEPLQPEWGHVSLSLYREVTYAYTSYEWHSDCAALMSNHLSHQYPPPPDPWIEDLGKDDPTYRILFFMGVTATILVFVYLAIKISGKLGKKPRILTHNKSSFFVANLFFPIRLVSPLFVSRPQLDNIIMHQHYQNITSPQQIQNQ